MWREEFSLYVSLAMEGKTDEVKVQMLKYLIGYRGREVYQTVRPEVETLQNALDALAKHCDPPKNETVNRYRFFMRKQESGESFDSFVTELKLLAEQCNFGDFCNSLIRDRIVCGIKANSMRERLLREPALTLDKCVHACRASELSKQDAVVLEQTEDTAVHAVRQKKPYTVQKKGTDFRNRTSQSYKSCRYCGQQHVMRKEDCPAFGKTCTRCGKLNHFKIVCRTNIESKIHEVDFQTTEEHEMEELMTVTDVIDVNTVKADSSHLYATMLVQGQQVKFQLDSGASCNVLPRHALKLHGTRLKRTEHVLSMYNKTVIQPAGRCSLDVVNPRSQEEFEIEFFVVDHPGAVPLLGSKTVQEMGLIHVNRDKILAVTTGMGKINNMAELMSRRTRTLLPTTRKLLKPEVQSAAKELKKVKLRQKFHYDKSAKDLPPLHPGDVVRIHPTKQQSEWQKGVVLRKTSEPRSYLVKRDDGGVYRRNRRHLRRTQEPMTTSGADVDIPDDQTHANIPPEQQQHVQPRNCPRDQQNVTTRSGRVVRPPKHFADYVRK